MHYHFFKIILRFLSLIPYTYGLSKERFFFPFKNLVNSGLSLKQQSSLNYSYSNKTTIIIYYKKKTAQKKINKSCFPFRKF